MNQKKHIFEKTINVFAWLSFVLAIVITILTFGASFSGSDNGKAIFGHKLLIVNTDSMSKSPLSENEEIFFNAGDLIVIKTAEQTTSFKQGDVITFISSSQESFGKTLTHKIREVKISDGQVVGYITYGINTGTNDTAMVPVDNVIGVYSFKLPHVGKIFSFLKTPQGYYLSLLIPVILLITFFSLRAGKSLGVKATNTQYKDEIDELKEIVVRLETICQNMSACTTDVTVVKDSGVSVSEVIENCETETPTEEVQDNDEYSPEKLNIPKGNKISFAEKLLGLEENVQSYFNIVHNEIVSYKKVSNRFSFKCVSYRFGRKLLAKMTVRGKTLKLHLALYVNEFNQNVFFQKDLSNIKAYNEVPFTVKIKSERGKNNALKLTDSLKEKFGLIKNDKYLPVNAIELLKNFSKEQPLIVQEENTITNKLSIPNSKKLSFSEKLLGLDKSIQEYFNAVHEELISYKKVHERVSIKCVSYRLGRKLLAKMTVRGKTLKLHLALDVTEFNQNVFFQKDLSDIKAYNEVPFTVKIKSQRGKNNAVKLISTLMEKNTGQKKEKFVKIDPVTILKNN